MSSDQVVLIDLGPHVCSGGNCESLASILRNCFQHIQCDHRKDCDFPAQAKTPGLLIFRTQSTLHLSQCLEAVRARWSLVPVLAILCEAWKNTAGVLNCFTKGLDDFARCPVQEADLAARAHRLLQKAQCHTKAGLPGLQVRLDFLIGESRPFRQLLDKIPPIAHSRMTVLLSGETGSGKELLARAIHYLSPRKSYPFIPVNCGALPAHLFENELFGHVKGAYTDASSNHSGLLAASEGGTLFLDEIDALSPTGQVKMLRFLQSREYRPLGSSRILTADVRVIAATNADLRQEIQNKRFREDLFHRLNILHLSIPPLRERADDIPCMVKHFLTKIAAEEKQESKGLTLAALGKLQSYHWPGNVRELEAVLQRAVIISGNRVLDDNDLELPTDATNSDPMQRTLQEVKNHTISQVEHRHVASLLAAHNGNMTRAAQAAGTTRRTLQRLVRKHKIQREDFVRVSHQE